MIYRINRAPTSRRRLERRLGRLRGCLILTGGLAFVRRRRQPFLLIDRLLGPSDGPSRDDLEDGLQFDRDAGGQGGEAQGAAGVVAEAVLAEDLVVKVGSAVDDQV